MSHFLYKPHVLGASGCTTTPDLLIDRVELNIGKTHCLLPVHRLSTANELQAANGALLVCPAIALVSAGGGDLVAPAAVVSLKDSPATTSDVVISRNAWRQQGIDGELAATFTLNAQRGNGATGAGQATGELPPLSGDGEPLMRGVTRIVSIATAVVGQEAPLQMEVSLLGCSGRQRTSLQLSLLPAGSSHWADWPESRYSTGPVYEVEHYL